MNVHPDLLFEITAVTFHEKVMGMLEQDGHLTPERKAQIYAEWTPRIGELLRHTGSLPEGVQWRQVWRGPYDEKQWRARTAHCEQCRRADYRTTA